MVAPTGLYLIPKFCESLNLLSALHERRHLLVGGAVAKRLRGWKAEKFSIFDRRNACANSLAAFSFGDVGAK